MSEPRYCRHCLRRIVLERGRWWHWSTGWFFCEGSDIQAEPA